MREIGGYLELDTYCLQMLHEDAIALNCGRNCLAYLFKSRDIKKLKVPYFICNSIFNVCEREGIEKVYYHIGPDFKPAEDLILAEDEWLYLVNFYGQLSNNDLKEYTTKFGRVIIDQANAYFADPLSGVDTFYTCRKWFGVADGAFLYTDIRLPNEFPQDESFDRMRFLLGRYERTAGEFYGEYSENNSFFCTEPIKRMSKLTLNLLHGIDYKAVEKKRTENFLYLQEKLEYMNQLRPKTATFMYPLMVENGRALRKRLQTEKIYIPMLWPTVLKVTTPEDPEYKMAENILPLPVDQRYGIDSMKYMIKKIYELSEVN